MRRMFELLLALLLAAAPAGAAMAADGGNSDMVPPDQLVKQTTQEVLGRLRDQQAEVKKDPTIAYGIVREVVLPHFDFPLISRFVLGRNWNTATPQQRKAFMDAFKTLLIRTYGTSLAEYSGQQVQYLPMQSDTANGRVIVRTKILQPDGPPIPMDYRLHKTDEGWKVFDVIVEGASYVQTYRSEYSSVVASKGMDGLIQQLRDKVNQDQAPEPPNKQ